MTNEVEIFFMDQDSVVLAGTPTLTPTLDTSARLSGYLSESGTANSDKIQYSRYFVKGGTYKVRIVYEKNTNCAKIDVGLDSSTAAIFSQIDAYNASQTRNNVLETFIEIYRGWHNITLLANGKNASSSAYVMPMQAIQFDLIAEYPVAQDFPPMGELKTEWMEFDMSDENVTIVSSTGTKATKFPPFAGGIIYVYAQATTAPTGGTVLKLDVQINSTSMFTVLPAFVASSKTSTDGTQKSIPQTFSKGDQIDAIVNQVDSGGTTKGLKLYALVYKLG